MAQAFILDGQGGLPARDIINNNFSELFGAGQFPIKIANVGGSFTIDIPANSWLTSIYISPLLGTPNISIGYEPAGGEIIDSLDITQFTPISVQQYFDVDAVLYFTFNNTDTCNIRIDLITDFN